MFDFLTGYQIWFQVCNSQHFDVYFIHSLILYRTSGRRLDALAARALHAHYNTGPFLVLPLYLLRMLPQLCPLLQTHAGQIQLGDQPESSMYTARRPDTTHLLLREHIRLTLKLHDLLVLICLVQARAAHLSIHQSETLRLRRAHIGLSHLPPRLPTQHSRIPKRTIASRRVLLQFMFVPPLTLIECCPRGLAIEAARCTRPRFLRSAYPSIFLPRRRVAFLFLHRSLVPLLRHISRGYLPMKLDLRKLQLSIPQEFSPYPSPCSPNRCGTSRPFHRCPGHGASPHGTVLGGCIDV
jgi:hypothetical protein